MFISLIHNKLAVQNTVRALKFLPLRSNSNYRINECWTIHFHTDYLVSATAPIQAHRSEIRRSDSRLVAFSLESHAGSFVWTAYRLLQSERTHRYNNCTW